MHIWSRKNLQLGSMIFLPKRDAFNSLDGRYNRRREAGHAGDLESDQDSQPFADAPPIDGGVGDSPSDDRMFNRGQELYDVIIGGYLAVILVSAHFGRHRVSYVVGIRCTSDTSIDPRPGEYFRFTLQNQQTILN